MAKPGSTASAFLPKEVTAGQLAELVGASERMIRGRISDGRLPRDDAGRINLQLIVQSGIDRLAEQQRRRGKGEGNDMRPSEARDTLVRLAVWLQTQLVPELASRAASRVGIPEKQREALFDALLTDAPVIGNTILLEMQVNHGEVGEFRRMDHLERGGGAAFYARFLDG